MQPGAGRADGRPHRLGRFGGRHTQVVHEHDHGPMLNAELPERVIELVVDGDLRGRIQTIGSS